MDRNTFQSKPMAEPNKILFSAGTTVKDKSDTMGHTE
jgi:hypothetical protein